MDRAAIPLDNAHYSTSLRGAANDATINQTPELQRIVPHPRTLRKAREQVKQMVTDEVSPLKIRNYLRRWVQWWVSASQCWQYQKILEWFLLVCWDFYPAAYGAGLLQHAINKTCQDSVRVQQHSDRYAAV